MTSTMVAGMLAGMLLSGSVQAGAQSQSAGTSSGTLVAEFVHRLPPGSLVRLRLSDGTKLEATLMGHEDDTVIVKRRTRLPEPPMKVELTRIVDADVVRGSSLGKVVAIGAAVGAGAVVGVFVMLAAIFSD